MLDCWDRYREILPHNNPSYRTWLTMAGDLATKQPPHVVLLACPGAGHVLPVIELARRLAMHGGVTATVITYTNLTPPAHSSTLASLPASVSTATLPAVDLGDLPADARIETLIITVVNRALPHLRFLLVSLLDSPSGIAAFLPDFFCSAALHISKELGVPGYLIFPSNLMALVSFLYLPELDRTTSCEYRDLPEPVRLPGCVPLRGADLVDTIQDRANVAYSLLVQTTRDFFHADGFLVNTFDEMEPETIEALRELSNKGVFPPAYAVGPFIRPCSDEVDKYCLQWLDGQPSGSVLYVCFGSGGTLSVQQTAELAAGLEASGQRFLWVVRFPSDADRSASFFGTTPDSDDPLGCLPEGFVERTKGIGLALPTWAPQVEVLQHPAVGGFLSHCGWNSTLESAAAGVPMVAWPLYAEQRMNTVMLTERIGLALRPREREDRVVAREEVEAVVRELMVGEKGETARQKARELREAATKAWAPEGASRTALVVVAGKWSGAAGAEDGVN